MTNAAAKRDTTRAREMGAVLKRWERSGLPVARFAEREGLARKTLYRWRRRLGVGGRRLRPGRPKGSLHRHRAQHTDALAQFTEVSSTLRTPASWETRFEVELGGMTIRVPPGFDPAALEQLVKTLSRC